MTLYSLVKKYNISKALFVTYFTFLALILYFLLTAFFGQKGLVKYFSLREKIYDQSLQKKELQNVIKQKKNKVQGMKPESLDLDLLDEEARKNLGYSKESEIIIYKEKEKNGK